MLSKRLMTSVLTALLACAVLSCAPDSRNDSLLGPESSEVQQPQQSAAQGVEADTATQLTVGDASLLETQGYYWIKAPPVEQPRSLLRWLIRTVEATLSLLLDVAGGVLNLLGHSLLVPPGAVSAPTIFSMTVIENGYIEVDLTATPKSLLTRLFRWGRTTEEVTFDVPVELSLSYARATNVTDPTRLKIMRLLPNGRHEILPSTVDTVNQTVTAELDHFSRYCMIAN